MAPDIEFIDDAVVERADGRERIAKGTVQHGVSEATAARWERRGKAKRLPSAIERAVLAPVPLAPVPPAPPAPDVASKTAATPYVPGGDGKTEQTWPSELD